MRFRTVGPIVGGVTQLARSRLIGAALAATLALVACGSDDTAESDATTTTDAPTDESAAAPTGPPEGCDQGEPTDDEAATAVFNAAAAVLPDDVALESESTRENIDDRSQLEISLFICSEHLEDDEAVGLALELARALEASDVGDRIIRMGVNLFSPQGSEFPDPDGQVIADSFQLREWNSDVADEGALRSGLELRR